MAGLNSRRARRLRTAMRKLDAMDLSVDVVEPDRVEHSVRELLRLHVLQWESRRINVQHTEPRFMDHLTRATRSLVVEDRAVLKEFRVRGRLRACDLTVVGKDFVGGYLYGADPELRAEADVLTMLLRDNLETAHRLAKPVLSLLRGDEPHKAKFGCEAVVNQRVMLGRGVRSAAYAASAGTRAAGQELLKRRCPRLVERFAAWR
nr:GNAT family N-acetyltransferase [Nonomuraea sp. K271]